MARSAQSASHGKHLPGRGSCQVAAPPSDGTEGTFLSPERCPTWISERVGSALISSPIWCVLHVIHGPIRARRGRVISRVVDAFVSH